jgi:hypothetical protein
MPSRAQFSSNVQKGNPARTGSLSRNRRCLSRLASRGGKGSVLHINQECPPSRGPPQGDPGHLRSPEGEPVRGIVSFTSRSRARPPRVPFKASLSSTPASRKRRPVNVSLGEHIDHRQERPSVGQSSATKPSDTARTLVQSRSQSRKRFCHSRLRSS